MPGADPPPAEYDAGSVVADMDLDRFMELAEAFVDRIPEKLLEGLNGGIHVVEEAQWREGDPPGVAVLGEYVTDPHLGASIVLYYGSFIELFGDDEAQIEAELWETIRHEVRHHVEAWAGVDDLDREDAEELSRFFQEAYENGSAPGGEDWTADEDEYGADNLDEYEDGDYDEAEDVEDHEIDDCEDGPAGGEGQD